MCAVDATEEVGVEVEGVLDSPTATSALACSDGGSSTLSSLADDEEVSDIEPVPNKSFKKVKVMCSYGGRILPRPHDNQLRYVGGETRILVVKKGVKFQDLMDKLSRLAKRGVTLKYQLPNEDLDALITVSSDEDVANMMDEHDKMESRSSDGGVKLRAFLFLASNKIHQEESHLKKSPSFGVHHKAKMPRNHSDERKLIPPSLQQVHVNDPSFGSLKAYQEDQKEQQPRLLENHTCDCSWCNQRVVRAVHVDSHSHFPAPKLLHHVHHHESACKVCFPVSGPAHPKMNFGHHQHYTQHQHHPLMRTNVHDQHQQHQKLYKSPEFSSALPGMAKCSYPYHHQHTYEAVHHL